MKYNRKIWDPVIRQIQQMHQNEIARRQQAEADRRARVEANRKKQSERQWKRRTEKSISDLSKKKPDQQIDKIASKQKEIIKKLDKLSEPNTDFANQFLRYIDGDESIEVEDLYDMAKKIRGRR